MAALCRWTLDFFPQPSPGSRDPALRPPFRGGVPRFSDDAVRWVAGLNQRACHRRSSSPAVITIATAKNIEMIRSLSVSRAR